MATLHIPILNYHKIEIKADFGITARHPSDFDQDLICLKEQGFQTVTFSDIANGKLPFKPVMITFDDGYLSFFEKALPILKNHDMKAVVYIPTDFIGCYNDWDVHFGRFKYRHMNSRQIAAVSAAGMEIGSHTCSHRFLNILTQSTVENELKKSRDILEKITEKKILSVSYPFGRANANVVHQAMKYYTYGVALNADAFKTGNYMSGHLPRVNVYRTDSHKRFKKKIRAAQNATQLGLDYFIQQGALATITLQRFQGMFK